MEETYKRRILDDAIGFAVKAHSGMLRKDGVTPYIVHPLEVLVIAGAMTHDPEVLAAAVLHDTVEDTGAKPDEIRERFGARVARLVSSETEDKRTDLPPSESWMIRKRESLEELLHAEDPGVKILWLSDKLANMRAFYRDWKLDGNALWKRFHQSDPAKQAWYYRKVGEYTKDLSQTEAWREYSKLTEIVFEGV